MIAAHPLSSLVERSLFTLDDYDISRGDFGGLPEYPADCIEGQILRPFTEVERQEFDDAEGNHMFWLSRLKGSLVSVFAAVPEQDTELFCRRWSEHWIYSPFQGWENVPLEVAEQKCRDLAFQRLRPFLTFFRLLCQKTLAEGGAIYVLWERHEKPTA